ncbi:MAG: SH3 domain-containing protein [Erysipelotrichia bacterium]|nr:SH3 domain-containing protein [Erysipelotrichia bacterium]
MARAFPVIIKSLFQMFLLLLLLHPGILPAGEAGIINTAGGLNLREQPAKTGKLLARLKNGTKVEILDKSGPCETVEGIKDNWLKVSVNGKTGWVFGGFIKPFDAKTADKASDALVSSDDFVDNEPAQSEKIILKKFPTKVTRLKHTLKLHCAEGKGIELVNDDSDGESYTMYYCIDFIEPEGLFLIHVQLYEGAEYFVVNSASGRTFNLGDRPIFSPQRTRLAVAGFDVTAAYDFNGIRIFRVEKGDLALEYESEPEVWGPQNFIWKSETVASFDQVSVVDGIEKPGKTVSLTLDAAGSKWQLQPPK